MSASDSREGRRASGARLRASNSSGNSTRGMVSRWLDGVSVATTVETTTTTQFSRAGTSGEVVTPRRATEAAFQTLSQEVVDLSGIPSSTTPRPPRQPTPTFRFDPPSAFDSYDTTPSTSALPSPSQNIHSSSAPNQEPSLAQVDESLSALRHSRVWSEDLTTTSSVPVRGYTGPSSAPGSIAAGGIQRVFTAGAGAQPTLGDIAPGATDEIRRFWAEVGTEEHGGRDGEYAYVAVGGGVSVGNFDSEREEEGEEEEREYPNELASEINHRPRSPNLTHTSIVPPAWSDVSSSTSSGSSLSTGGPIYWGVGTPSQLSLEGGTSVEQVEGEAGNSDLRRGNPLNPFDQITGPRAPFTLPPTLVDTLPPFFFPSSPARGLPSIFEFRLVSPPLAPVPTPRIPYSNPLTESQELENWTMDNLEQYSRLPSSSPSGSSSSTLPYQVIPTPWDPAATDSTACPICYENQVTREFPCSIPSAQHGLCGPCFVEYEGYCTDVVRCPLCRHEFFGSQVLVIECVAGAGKRREEGEGEEEGVGPVAGDEGADVRSEVGSEADGEHESVDEEEIELYMGGYRM